MSDVLEYGSPIAVLGLLLFLALATRLPSVAVGLISGFVLTLAGVWVMVLDGYDSFAGASLWIFPGTIFFGLIGTVAAFLTRLIARQFRDWPFDAKKE